MTIQDWQDDLLLLRYSHLLQAEETARHEAGVVEQEIMHRMREREAIAIPSDVFTCELQQANTYEQSRFTPLKELLSHSDLVEVWFPEHFETKTVPDKWVTAKLLAIARRYGGEVKRIVEEARVQGTPKLKFSRKE